MVSDTGSVSGITGNVAGPPGPPEICEFQVQWMDVLVCSIFGCARRDVCNFVKWVCPWSTVQFAKRNARAF
ncbi:hypothetical protein ZWY2020_037122 [Hordeum vulgare]|nr:hypothetical protein ZWY2020_037122 [Hordeum vulgare]